MWLLNSSHLLRLGQDVGGRADTVRVAVIGMFGSGGVKEQHPMKNTDYLTTNVSQLQPTYFELQAYWGATKHMGGVKTTRDLIELCRIDTNSYVLDVGCGVDATPSYLARQVGCKVVGIDISDAMLARAQEKIERDGVTDHVELRLSDVQHLPFDDGTFDAAIVESVLTFVADKQKAISECARVIKLGGYVGINEETWLKPPTPKLVEYAARTWDIPAEILMTAGWVELLTRAGLRDIIARPYAFNASLGEYLSEIRRYSFREYFAMFSRALGLYFKNAGFRKYMKGRFSSVPKEFFQYLGYGIFAGKR